MENSFFLRKTYNTEIDLETNGDVLERIYEDNISANEKLNINFAFITDTKDKAECFSKKLADMFPNYTNIEVNNYEEIFEVTGLTEKIQMSLAVVNNWNTKMWDLGYKYDCKFDGWFVEGN